MLRFFKKLFTQRGKSIEEKLDKLNIPIDERPILDSFEMNISTLKQIFHDMDMIQFRMIQGTGEKPLRCYLAYCDGMTNDEIINNNIIKPLMSPVPKENRSSIETLLAETIQIAGAKTIASFKDVIEGITSGDTILFVEGAGKAAVLNTRQISTRAIDEPENEKTLGGPREGFTESMLQNLTQVVRRVHSNDLKIKTMNLGRRTKTQICVCYFDTLADKKTLNTLLEQLNKIDIDGVLDSNYITELIRDNRHSPFRTTGYTERPDVVLGKLLEGRIAVFVDGTPMVLTVPYLFIENFQNGEDYYFSYYYTSFARLLRICAFILTVSVPGLYIAAVAFHQEMLPLQLLIRIVLERQSVPLPAAFEAVIMLFVFDLLRETGIRMPSNIGQPLSIVGALVIGQAAVEAKLVAAPMIIVVAATGITGLLVPKLNAPIIFWRLILLFMSSSFGFFGLTIGFSWMIIHINNLSSLGVPQTTLSGRLRFQENKDILLRAPWSTMIKRPENLTSNQTRQTGGDDNG